MAAPDVNTASDSFLKLCKIKYYNYSPIHSIQPNFSLQTGDPLGPRAKDSDGGSCIWGLLPSSAEKVFTPEFHPGLKHTRRGTVSMATTAASKSSDTRLAGSQFIITLGDNLDYLDGKAAIFGECVESDETLDKLNKAFVDQDGHPLKDIRIRHTHILEEADIPDPPGLVEPPTSPMPTAAQLATVRIPDDEEIDENADPEEVDRLRREREARAQALTLEMVGDLPFADVKPPENVLFVCKLNPVTRGDDLELIFGRFGKILSCEIIRDKRTGDSLQYAFIEFEEKRDCEQAYAKMEAVLIDDCRIHVDFSQSVSKLSNEWREATVKKRQRGGFGGFDNLEKRRQYRVMEDEDERRDGYGLVLEDKAKQERPRERNGGRARSRSRSPRRRREDSRDRSYRDHDRSRRDERRYRSRSRDRRGDARDHRDDRDRHGRR